MRDKNGAFFIALFILLMIGSLWAQEKKEMHERFEAKERVRIGTTSGDCIIQIGNSDEIKVDLVYNVQPEDAFEPDIEEKGNSLRIRERWYGSSSGRVTWTLTVPPTTEIEFSTASGDLSVDGLQKLIEANTASGDITIESSSGEYDISTASGDVELTNSSGKIDISTASGDVKFTDNKGEFDLSTASGDIRIRNCSGVFEASCASGEIKATGIVIEEESTFSTASGDVEVNLGQTSEYDLELSASSGDVSLDYAGNEIKGYFEFRAKKSSGSIRSPIDFDNEEVYDRHGRDYVKKSFTRGGNKPVIRISTSSGKAELKE